MLREVLPVFCELELADGATMRTRRALLLWQLHGKTLLLKRSLSTQSVGVHHLFQLLCQVEWNILVAVRPDWRLLRAICGTYAHRELQEDESEWHAQYIYQSDWGVVRLARAKSNELAASLGQLESKQCRRGWSLEGAEWSEHLLRFDFCILSYSIQLPIFKIKVFNFSIFLSKFKLTSIIINMRLRCQTTITWVLEERYSMLMTCRLPMKT